jgi:hypothetical protein
MTVFSPEKTQEFITLATEKHGNKYTYEKVQVRDGTGYKKDKLTIYCLKHGYFDQSWNSHLSSSGCIKCAHDRVNEANTKTQEQVIAEFQEVHGTRYKYHLVDYKKGHIPVLIECTKHGVFSQTPSNHLQGGCETCSYELRSENLRQDRDSLIADFNRIHNSVYDYSLMEDYKNGNDKITVICKKHEPFKISILKHKAGQGCKECGKLAAADIRRLDQSVMLERYREAHGDRYGYDYFEYKTAHTKIKVECFDHGIFEITARDHVKSGCPKCRLAEQSSHISHRWLDSLGIPLEKEYRFPQYKGRPVDGFHVESNTIYQFHGDYFHGNPVVYDANEYNALVKKTFGAIYENSCRVDQDFRDLGCNLVIMWEHDWKIHEREQRELRKQQVLEERKNKQ